MSDRPDLEGDLVEEEELHTLLAGGDRDLVAPDFAVIERRVRGARLLPAFGSLALAAFVVVLAVGIASWRTAAPAASPSPSTAIATALPNVAPPGATAPALCREPSRPAYLPWPSSQTQVQTTSTSTEATFFGPGTEPSRALVRISIQPYADPGPPTRSRTVGEREIYLSSTPAEARAWWREPGGACPLISVALVWPDMDPSSREAELLRIVVSIPTTAAATPTPRAADTYGVAVRRPDGRVDVLHEQDGSAVATLNDPSSTLVVSPNGREIAYWGGIDARELWIAPARDLQQRRKLTTITNERGAGIVWSPDGASLLVGAASTTFGPGPEAAPIYTALRVIGRDGSGLREIARIDTGQFVRPLAWDAAQDLGAAEEGAGQKGPGRYVLISARSTRPLLIEGSKTSYVRFMDLPDAREANVSVEQPQASADGRFVMSTWHYYGGRDVIRFWPLEGLDGGRIRDLAPERPGETIRGAAWRPQSLEIGATVAGTFQLWALDGQRRRVRDLGGTAAFLSFRYDGTALYVAALPGTGRIELTELGSGRTRELSPTIEAPVGSVDLADGR